VNGADKPSFPILGQGETDDADETAACSPKIYVSNQEAALLAAMREVKARGRAIRDTLADPEAAADRPALETELEALRCEWRELDRRRDLAFRTKMVMLGHLPPSALDE